MEPPVPGPARFRQLRETRPRTHGRRVEFRPRPCASRISQGTAAFEPPSGTGGGVSPLLRRPLPCASEVPATVPDQCCRKARTAAPPHTSLPDAVVTSLPAAPPTPATTNAM